LECALILEDAGFKLAFWAGGLGNGSLHPSSIAMPDCAMPNYEFHASCAGAVIHVPQITQPFHAFE
jgi:hypothetical protein